MYDSEVTWSPLLFMYILIISLCMSVREEAKCREMRAVRGRDIEVLSRAVIPNRGSAVPWGTANTS